MAVQEYGLQPPADACPLLLRIPPTTSNRFHSLLWLLNTPLQPTAGAPPS